MYNALKNMQLTDGGGPLCWWVGNDHQPPGLSCVINTALLSHEWHTFYSGCLLTHLH